MIPWIHLAFGFWFMYRVVFLCLLTSFPLFSILLLLPPSFNFPLYLLSLRLVSLHFLVRILIVLLILSMFLRQGLLYLRNFHQYLDFLVCMTVFYWFLYLYLHIRIIHNIDYRHHLRFHHLYHLSYLCRICLSYLYYVFPHFI